MFLFRAKVQAREKVRVLSFFLIFLFLFSGVSGLAFSRIRPALRFGVGRADLFGADCYRQEWKTVLSGGLTAEINVWKKLNLESGILFMPGGAIYRSEDEETGYQETVSLDYLAIPLLAKFYFWQNKNLAAYLAAGPAVLLNVGARLEVISAGQKYSVKLDNLQGQELSFNLAAGAELKTGPGFFLVELAYSQGTNSISREPEEEVKNRRVFCFLGFRF